MNAYKLDVRLRNLDEYRSLVNLYPDFFAASTEDLIVKHVLLHGIVNLFWGFTPAEQVGIVQIEGKGRELREHLFCRNLNSRQRAVLDCTIEFMIEKGLAEHQIRIYGHEAITPFALHMRGRFPKYLGTEYCSNQEQMADIFPIPHADILDLRFPSGAFDLIVSNDVLEHVPDIDKALGEAIRILKPGGKFIGTFPFLFDRDVGVRFATLIDGVIVQHTDNLIYHGNPMGQDSLVFEIPGWDIIQRAESVGFKEAAMRFLCDQNRGILASYSQENSTPKGLFLAEFIK